MRNLEEFKSAAVWARANLNPTMFAYAMNVALLHREDTKGLAPPSEADVFPRKFIEGSVFSKAREEISTVEDPNNRVSTKTYMLSFRRQADWRETQGTKPNLS